MSEFVYTRDIYGKTLVELGKKHPKIVVLDADLSSSTRTSFFRREFPNRFFNLGVAEQNMMGVAAGLASCNKVVFVSTFAMFATGRCWDQIRNTICYNEFNVKIVATHGGITVGPDGSSHQALEDIALMRSIPGMKIIIPCDAEETREAIISAYNIPGPFYIRLGRPKFPIIKGKKKFQFGKGYVIEEGRDVSIVACGFMVYQALQAREILVKEGIRARVINIHTIKPLDEELIISSFRQTKRMVICEEHSIIGGLGSAICELIGTNFKLEKIKLVGTRDRFGQSGEPQELLEEYKLSSLDIVDAAKKLLEENS